MTKATILSFFLLLSSSQLMAQQSIGFSDSTDFQYLIDYQLPDWSYSNFYLSAASFSLSGLNEDAKVTANRSLGYDEFNQESTRINGSLSLSPTYEYFRESETIQTTFDISGAFTANAGKESFYADEITGDRTLVLTDEEESDETRNYNLSINYTTDRYVFTNDIYYTTGINSIVLVNQSNRTTENQVSDPNDYSDFNRRILTTGELGIGIGRIRNITPVLRAIRLKERNRTLNNGDFNNNEILSAAEQFTKYVGYQNRYDRSDKYFWSDMNQVLGNQLSANSYYDVFYLQDVLLENLGSRFEGYEAELVAGIGYSNRLERRKVDGELTDRYSEIIKTPSLSANFRWYKNLSLNHQLAFTTHNSARIPYGSSQFSADPRWTFNSVSTFSWLWNIADRMLLTSSLNGNYQQDYHEEDSGYGDDFLKLATVSSSLTYFIENRLALTGGLNFSYRDRSDDFSATDTDVKRYNWGIQVSLRYYFDRKLF